MKDGKYVSVGTPSEVGAPVGMLYWNPLPGVGATSGKLADIGISDKFMKELAEAFRPDTSTLFVLVKKVTPDKVLERLKGHGGKVFQTSLTKDKEEELQKVLTEL